jgi:hypothetical protein
MMVSRRMPTAVGVAVHVAMHIAARDAVLAR